jgi:micrococcal nuclease
VAGGTETDCDPAYPDACIPPPPPDLDCADVPYRRFTVRPPDPHSFDGDRDGIGCET